MGQILGVVFPLFAIIALGKLAVHFRFLDATDSAVLSRFAFFLPVPALLFGVLAEGPAADVFGPGGIYFAGCSFLYCVALCVGRWLKDPSLPHSAVFALDTTFGNLVFLGTPLVLALFRDDGGDGNHTVARYVAVAALRAEFDELKSRQPRPG